MADLYKYEFTYHYGGGGDSYQGYLYAEEGSYTVGLPVYMEDGGFYLITYMSQVEDNDASAGEVYISSYYDRDGSGGNYTPDNYQLGLAAGTEGLGSESERIFGREFGYITNGDTTEVVAVDVDDDGEQFKVTTAIPVSLASGIATNFNLSAESDLNQTFLTITDKELSNNFSNPLLINEFSQDSDFTFLVNHNSGANKEENEPLHAGNLGGASVWHTWTATESSLLELDVNASFPELVAIYTGNSLESLTEIVSYADAEGEENNLVAFYAAAGNTYYLAVDSYNNGGEIKTGEFELGITSDTSFGKSDDVAIISNQTVFSELEVNGLPGSIGDVDIWLSFTHEYHRDLDVYLISPEGTRVELFTDIGIGQSGYFSLFLDDQATNILTDETIFGTSQTYQPEGELSDFSGENPNGTWRLEITDDAFLDEGNLSSWDLDFGLNDLPITNDDFTNAIDLNEIQELSLEIFNPFELVWESNNLNATKETEEPSHGNNVGGASVWYSWTAPESGVVSISTEGSDFDTTLGVYTGYSVDNLTTVAINDDADYINNILTSEVALEVVAGQTYYIAVDGYNGATGNFDLEISPVEVTFANYEGWEIEDRTTLNAEIVVDYLFTDEITDVDVELTFDHSYHADLDVFLVKLDSEGIEAERVELFSDIGVGQSGLTTVNLDDEAVDPITGTTSLGGTYQPVDSLADLDSGDANGTWVLEVTDDAGVDVGFLYNWSITFGFSEVNDIVTFSPTNDFPTTFEPNSTIDLITV